MPLSKVQIRRNNERLERRRKHVKKLISKTSIRPRLIIYRSNKHMYASIMDDLQGKTLLGCSTLTSAIKEKIKKGVTRIDQAKLVGEHIATLAKEKGIADVAFDRNGRRYHGRVKAVAEGARAGGLNL